MPRAFLRVRCLTVLVAVACLATVVARPVRVAALEDAPSDGFASTVLGNGLRVVVAVDRAAPVVSTAMWYRFGANEERPGQRGLAHALAHEMFDGTPYLSSAALDDAVTRFGGKESATTANDYTTYRFVLPSDKLELALRIEADRMQHLLISEDSWQREKRALRAERAATLSGPLAKLYASVCAAASAAPVCALSALGDDAALAGAGAEDLRSYYQDWYVPNNATLVVSGDVTSARVFALARSAFGAIPASTTPEAPTSMPAFAQDKQVEVAGDFPYEVVDLAFAAPGRLDPDSDAFAIVDSIVNNRRSNFYKGLVRSGYTLGYSTQLDQNLRGGLYHVFLIAAPGHTSAQARDAFVDIMSTAQTHGFDDDLVRAAKIAIGRRDTYARDSISGLGERVGYATGVEGALTPGQSDTELAATSASDVQRAARTYFAAPAVTGLLQPSKTRADTAPPSTSVTDDFTRRPPHGAVIETAAFRRSIVAPVDIVSHVMPASFTLANGLRVLVQEQHANPTVFISGSAQTSPAFDPPGKDGTGAMYSTLLDDGTATTDFDARARALDEIGAQMHLALEFDAHGRSQDFATLAGLLADGLMHPALRAADVESVRKQTLSAVQERDADPASRADFDFDAGLFRAGDPELRAPTEESVAGITAADLRAYGRRYVRPDLTVVTIVGDVDPAEVRTVVEAAFGKWHSEGARPSLDPGPIPSAHAAMRFVVANQRDTQARVGTPAVALGSADYPALDVLNQLLGAGGAFDTRLVDDLREREHLVDRITSSLASDRFRGTFEIQLSAAANRIDAAMAGVRRELARLRVDPVGPFELDRARTKIVAGGFVSEESTAVVTQRVQRMGLGGLPLDCERTMPARYRRLDGAALLAAANAYLDPATLDVVYEGPQP